MRGTTVSFPGLGIGEFTMNKVAFELGNLQVRWYGIIITLGIVLAVLYVIWRGKYEGISSDDVLDYTIWTVLFAVLGARLYYVLTTLKTPSGEWNYTSFRDVIAIWEGGLAIYGGIIAGAATIVVVSLVKKFDKSKLIKMFDMVAPAVMLGQIIGRWGNFVNGEAHGTETAANFFLRMGLFEGGKMIYVHPTFLYESRWNLVGFVLINLLYKKKKFDGQVLLMYLGWYGFGRMFIEGLRTDSLYVGPFRISQVIGALCFVVSAILLVYFLYRARRRELEAACEYQPMFEKLRGVAFWRREAAKNEPATKEEDENTQDVESEE